MRIMKKYKYSYTICKDNSPEMFEKACIVLETCFPNIIKKELLVDVDGSTIQIFYERSEKIVVYDDYDVGAVYIESDIDLNRMIKKFF